MTTVILLHCKWTEKGHWVPLMNYQSKNKNSFITTSYFLDLILKYFFVVAVLHASPPFPPTPHFKLKTFLISPLPVWEKLLIVIFSECALELHISEWNMEQLTFDAWGFYSIHLYLRRALVSFIDLLYLENKYIWKTNT